MFRGVVPTACIQQIFRIMDFPARSRIAVCCSGTFKVDRALRVKLPEATIWSNDVSLYSTALGRLFTGGSLDFTFTGRLEYIEQWLEGREYVDRVSALSVACIQSQWKGNNRYAQEHFRYYRREFGNLVVSGSKKLQEATKKFRLDAYFARDWREHVNHAIKDGMTIVGFPPFFKGDYERQFRFVESNVRWEAPEYTVYDPKELGDIMQRIHDSGVPYCVLSDQSLEKMKPVGHYISARKAPHFIYARGQSVVSSSRRLYSQPQPIGYTPIDLTKVTGQSTLKVRPVEVAIVDYIKDVYLSKKIIHSSGCANYLVTIDGMTVGCLVYAYPKFSHDDPNNIHLLSDVTISPEAKLSKLVAKLGTSGEVVGMLEVALMRRITQVFTTARTPKPISMKYRGIYRKGSVRAGSDGENVIQYYSSVRRRESVADMFRWWWGKYGHKARTQAAGRTPAGGSQAAQATKEERPIHDGGPDAPAYRKHRKGRGAHQRRPGVSAAGR